jgi:hypothetical protein
MNFDQAITILNKLLTKKSPCTFNSSWILTQAPQCYRYFNRNIRTELGQIDWDRVTAALPRKFQRRWAPKRKPKSCEPYENLIEVRTILNKYKEKLYVFVAPNGQDDKRVRDSISIALVRLAQRGNTTARQEILKLARYTIDEWIENHLSLSRWRGYDEEIQKRLEACIRCYRYSGSFLHYVFLTLVYAGRGLQPVYIFSLDDPVAFGSVKRKIENIYKDAETNEIQFYHYAGNNL